MVAMPPPSQWKSTSYPGGHYSVRYTLHKKLVCSCSSILHWGHSHDRPYGPAPGALWEDSALTKVPSETSGGQHYAVDEGRRRWPSSFSTWTLKQLCVILLKTDLSASSASLSGTLWPWNDAGKSAMLVDYFSVSSLCFQQCASCCSGIISPSQEACGIWRWRWGLRISFFFLFYLLY